MLVFLSHAAIDEEIAKYLKEIVEKAFSGVKVFVSTDPEDLPPGDPWVETILQNLRAARLLLVLASGRGISRRWVWFELGAEWGQSHKIIPCCLGKLRKGSLPAPFSIYQQVNIDEEQDLKILLSEIGKELNGSAPNLDYGEISGHLLRLDIRAEERDRRKTQSPHSEKLRGKVAEGLRKLNEGEKEALRHLYLEGQITDRRAIELVRAKSLLADNPTTIFTRISSETGFVRRLWPFDKTELHFGYQGPYEINSEFREILGECLFPPEPSD